MTSSHSASAYCADCLRSGQAESVTIGFTFQPVVSVRGQCVVGHEAKPIGSAGESAETLRLALPPAQRPVFDQRCRVEAITAAARLQWQGDLCIDFSPARLFDPQRCIRGTLAALARHGMRREQLVLELSELEDGRDDEQVAVTVAAYRELGLRVAIDDFGAGHSGLNLLAQLQPDRIKLHRGLIAGVDSMVPRQAVLRGILIVCRELQIDAVAGDVRSGAEFRWLRDAGVDLFQGEYVAAPARERLPPVNPELFAPAGRVTAIPQYA